MSELLASQISLQAYLENLNEQKIKSLVAKKIFERGEEYYEEGYVEDLEIINSHKIMATVDGSRTYKITITEESQKIFANCTCPYSDEYDGVCKHIIAVLLQADFDDIHEDLVAVPNIPVAKPSPSASFEDYLNNLNVEELKTLVRKYMPEADKKAIEIQLSSQDIKETLFQDAKKKIFRFIEKFKGNSSDDYERGVMTELDILKGVWQTKAAEVKDILVKMMLHIDKCVDNSYFSDDDDYYGEGGYFEGEKIPAYISDFLASLPTESKVQIIPDIWDAIEASGYDTFNDIRENVCEYLKAADVEAFKPYFLSLEDYKFSTRIKDELYTLMHPFLDNKEKAYLLTEWTEKDVHFISMLLDLYELEWKDEKKALEMLDKQLTIDKSPSFYSRFNQSHTGFFAAQVRLTRKFAPEKLEKVYENYLRQIPSISVLEEIIVVYPDKKAFFEFILRQQSLSVFISYLEKNKRKEEALTILEQSSNNLNDSNLYAQFLKRNAQEFPEKTKIFYYAKLEENLKYTGDKHYDEVVACLQILKQVGKPEAFKQLLTEIRVEYKRRTNLITKLRNAFGN